MSALSSIVVVFSLLFAPVSGSELLNKKFEGEIVNSGFYKKASKIWFEVVPDPKKQRNHDLRILGQLYDGRDYEPKYARVHGWVHQNGKFDFLLSYTSRASVRYEGEIRRSLLNNDFFVVFSPKLKQLKMDERDEFFVPVFRISFSESDSLKPP